MTAGASAPAPRACRTTCLAAVLSLLTTACAGPPRAESEPAGAPPAPGLPHEGTLEQTAWRLVRFEGGDGAVLTPDDPNTYTIRFAAAGQLATRIDCNRGQSTWTSTAPGHLAFGPLALTRAQCPDGSLHDQIVKQWPYIRSYVLRDCRLYLSLMADGGIYEFEPHQP